MPRAFWSSAPVTFLDAESEVTALRNAAAALCHSNADVAAVVLFGSLARGTATPGSDVDLLVVLRRDSRRILDRVPEYTRPFEAPGRSVQVLPWTVEELRARLTAGDRFAQEIVETGIPLAGGLTAR